MADKFNVPNFEEYFFKLANDSKEIKNILADSPEDIGSFSFGGSSNNYSNVFGVTENKVDYDLFEDDNKPVTTKKATKQEPVENKTNERKVAAKLPIKQVKKQAVKLQVNDLFEENPSEQMNRILGDSSDPLALYLRQEATQNTGMVKQASSEISEVEIQAEAGGDVIGSLGLEWTVPQADSTESMTKTASRSRRSGGGGVGQRASTSEVMAAGFKIPERIGGGEFQMGRSGDGPITPAQVRVNLESNYNDNPDPDNIYVDKRDLIESDDIFGGGVGVVNSYAGSNRTMSSNDSRASFTTESIVNRGGMTPGGGGVGYGAPAINKTASVQSAIKSNKVPVNRFKAIKGGDS